MKSLNARFKRLVRLISTPDNENERKVKVSSNGSLYMEPEDYFKSPKIQAQIDQMIIIANRRKESQKMALK